MIQPKVLCLALEEVAVLNYIVSTKQHVAQCLLNTATKRWCVRMLIHGRVAFIRKFDICLIPFLVQSRQNC